MQKIWAAIGRPQRRRGSYLWQAVRKTVPTFIVHGGRQHFRQQHVPRFMINPETRPKLIWDALLTLCVLYTTCVVPYRVCFKRESTGGVAVFEGAVDVAFFTDLVLNFITGVHLPTGDVSYETSVVARAYLRGWFIVDFLSTIPFEAVASWFGVASAGNSAALASAKLLRGLKVLRLFKLARLRKLNKVFSNLEDAVSTNQSLLALSKLALTMLFLAHLVACIWFAVGKIVEDDGASISWVSRIGYVQEDPDTQLLEYLSSMYWAIVTMVTIGYGDVVATTNLERLVNVAVMAIGVSFFGYVIGTISALVANLDVSAALYEERMTIVKEYIISRELPKHLSRRIRGHFEYYYQRRSVFGEKKILDRLPSALRNEMIHHVHAKLVVNVAFFGECHESLISDIVVDMKPFSVLKDEYVYVQHEIAAHVFFLLKGKVHLTKTVSSSRTDIRLAVLTVGEHFGELEVYDHDHGNGVRICSAIAKTYCELTFLSRQAISKLSARWPEVLRHFKDAAIAVSTRMRRRANIPEGKSYMAVRHADSGDDDDDEDDEDDDTGIFGDAAMEQHLRKSRMLVKKTMQAAGGRKHVRSARVSPYESQSGGDLSDDESSRLEGYPYGPRAQRDLPRINSISRDDDDGNCTSEEHCSSVGIQDNEDDDEDIDEARAVTKGSNDRVAHDDSRTKSSPLVVNTESWRSTTSSLRDLTQQSMSAPSSPIMGGNDGRGKVILESLVVEDSATSRNELGSEQVTAEAKTLFDDTGNPPLRQNDEKERAAESMNITGAVPLSHLNNQVGAIARNMQELLVTQASAVNTEQRSTHAGTASVPSPVDTKQRTRRSFRGIRARDVIQQKNVALADVASTATAYAVSRKNLNELVAKIRHTPTNAKPNFHAEQAMLKGRYILHPHEPFMVSWQFVVGIGILYSIVVVPFRLGFEADAEGPWHKLELVIDTFFFMDIVINFRTAFFDEERMLVYSNRAIVMRYLKGWFSVDVLSTIPIDEIATVFLDTNSTQVNFFPTKILRLFRIARLLKLARLIKLSRVFGRLREFIQLSPSTERLLRLLLVIFLFCHWNACVFHSMMLTSETMGNISWCDEFFGAPVAMTMPTSSTVSSSSSSSSSLSTPSSQQVGVCTDRVSRIDRYIVAMYWAFTTFTTVGYGDIKPSLHAPHELSVVIVLIVVNATAFGYVISAVVTLIRNLNPSDREYRLRMTEMKDYLRDSSVSLRLGANIKKHYHHNMLSTSLFPEEKLFDKMSPSLRFDVARLVAGETLFAIPLITVMEDSFKGFVSYALFLMKPMCIMRTEMVCRSGGPGTEMFFLVEGECDLVNSMTNEGRIVGQNAVFEQYALMAKPSEIYRTILTVTAITKKCILYSLGIQEFRMLEDVSPAVSTYFLSQLAAVLIEDDLMTFTKEQSTNISHALRNGRTFRAVAEQHDKVRLTSVTKVAIAKLGNHRRGSEWAPDLLPRLLNRIECDEREAQEASPIGHRPISHPNNVVDAI